MTAKYGKRGNIGHIVREKRATTTLPLTYEIHSVSYSLFIAKKKHLRINLSDIVECVCKYVDGISQNLQSVIPY